MCFWKNCFARFVPPFFGHDIRVNIKKRFSHFFPTIFFPTFCSHYSNASGKIVSSVFSHIFSARYSCEYKKTFFALFFDDFFPIIFCSHYLCDPAKIVSRVYLILFFGHDIRVNIYKRFSHFFPAIFVPKFLLALFLCFWKNCFARFFPAIFWSRYSCEYIKTT